MEIKCNVARAQTFKVVRSSVWGFDPAAIPQMALRGQSICILLSDEALAKQCRDAAEGAGATIVLPDSDPPPNYVVAESTAGPEFLVSRLAAHANRMMLGAKAGSDSHHL